MVSVGYLVIFLKMQPHAYEHFKEIVYCSSPSKQTEQEFGADGEAGSTAEDSRAVRDAAGAGRIFSAESTANATFGEHTGDGYQDDGRESIYDDWGQRSTIGTIAMLVSSYTFGNADMPRDTRDDDEVIQAVNLPYSINSNPHSGGSAVNKSRASGATSSGQSIPRGSHSSSSGYNHRRSSAATSGAAAAAAGGSGGSGGGGTSDGRLSTSFEGEGTVRTMMELSERPSARSDMRGKFTGAVDCGTTATGEGVVNPIISERPRSSSGGLSDVQL